MAMREMPLLQPLGRVEPTARDRKPITTPSLRPVSTIPCVCGYAFDGSFIWTDAVACLHCPISIQFYKKEEDLSDETVISRRVTVISWRFLTFSSRVTVIS